MINIEEKDKITVNKAGRYDADVITGAKISIANGFIIPPVRNKRMPSWQVSKNKNKKACKFEIVLFFFSKK